MTRSSSAMPWLMSSTPSPGGVEKIPWVAMVWVGVDGPDRLAVRRPHDQCVAHLAHPGRDRHVDMGIGLLRVHAREQADGEAAPLLRAARGGFHHASQPAAQEHRTPLRQEASDRPRPLRLLRRAPAAADHRDEDASHQRAWRPAAAQ